MVDIDEVRLWCARGQDVVRTEEVEVLRRIEGGGEVEVPVVDESGPQEEEPEEEDENKNS